MKAFMSTALSTPGAKISIGGVTRILNAQESGVVVYFDKEGRQIRCRGMSPKSASPSIESLPWSAISRNRARSWPTRFGGNQLFPWTKASISLTA